VRPSLKYANIAAGMGKRPTWLLGVPLALIGSQAAHSADYWIVAPEPESHAKLLETTGHGYLGQLPFALGCALALVCIALVLRSLECLRGRTSGRLSYGLFAFVPPLAFALQEHLERFFHSGAWPWAAPLEPTFALGLLLTLPAGLLAYLVARALASVADAIGAALSAEPAGQVEATESPWRPAERPDPVRTRPLALALAKRGPPLPAAT